MDTFDPTQSTPPTEVYVFPSVNVINVPAVLDRNGRLVCATTSTYRATCPTTAYVESNSTTAGVDNHTQSAQPPEALQITGVNSNAESYFSTGPKMDSANVSAKFDMVQVSFSKPFVYAPFSDPFPTKIVNENLGYVPETLIEWIAQHPDYVSKYPGIASCLPGGPSIDFDTNEICSHPTFRAMNAAQLLAQGRASELTITSTVTIAGRGCFHPGACSTPAAPGAMPVAPTPVVTPEAQTQYSMFDLCHLQQGSHSY